MMSDLAREARDTAAKATGLRPDQVEAAVQEYRKATEALHQEPEWALLMCFSYRRGGGIAQYADPSGQTRVTMQINTGQKQGERGTTLYSLNGKPFETFGEARAAELLVQARTKPRSVGL
jgi:hypothetical protein